MYNRKTIPGLKDNLTNDLRHRVIDHRNRFLHLFILRYKELLPYLIQYQNLEETSINPVKLENSLRNNYNIAIGKATNGKIMILGYVKKRYNYMYDYYNYYRHNGENIEFTVPSELRPKKRDLKKFKEITNLNDCKDGDFIIVSNKSINYLDDRIIIEHYANELAEIVLSRYSLSMQSKINTIFIGQNNDESINKLVDNLYNGSPYIQVSKYFDVEDNLFTVDNSSIGLLFSELKREYQNKISELNNMLGINSLAVEKDSGVSDTEAKSNRGFTVSNANIYIESRQNEFNKLNKRYNTNIIVHYNDEVRSEIASIGGDMFEN